MQVIDIQDPTQPKEVGSYGIGMAVGVAISGNIAYVADIEGGLRIIDISNPLKPQELGSYTIGGPFAGIWALKVSVSGNYAYICCRQRYRVTYN